MKARLSHDEKIKVEEMIAASVNAPDYSDETIAKAVYAEHAIDVEPWTVGNIRRQMGIARRASNGAGKKSSRGAEVDAAAAEVRRKIKDGDVMVDDIEKALNDAASTLEVLGTKMARIHDMVQEYRRVLDERKRILIQVI